MRIAHITRDYPPHVRGGVSIAVEGLANAYHQMGHPGTVVSFEDWRPFKKSANSTPAAIRTDGPLEVLSVSSVTHLEGATDHVHAFQPDLILCHDPLLWEFSATLAEELDANTGLFVHVMHPWQDSLRNLQEPTASGRAHRKAIHDAQLVLCPTEAVKQALEHPWSTSQGKYWHTPLGITTLPTAHAQPGTQTPPRILVPGRLGDLKGTDVLLEIIPRVLARHPAAIFVLAGGVPGNARSERKWRAKLEAMGPQVEMRGWLSGEGLSSAFHEATLVLLPSRCETFGLAAAEALAHGRAVIANDIPAHRELLQDGLSGVLAQGTAEAFADAIHALIEDPERRRELETRGWLTARHRLLWEHSMPFHAKALQTMESLPAGDGDR